MIFVLSYCIFSALLAYYNFRLIEHGKRIYHALNGALHLAAAIIIGAKFGWQYGISLLLLVRVVFDTTLNICRGLGAGYMSNAPKSIVDKIEIWFIHAISTAIFYRKKYIVERDIEIVAIVFRLIILATGIYFLIP